MTHPFEKLLRDGLRVGSTAAEHCEQLERLQKVVFPTLAEEELFRAEHYHKHLELFPDGQFVVLDGAPKGERVVAMTSSVRMDFDFEHPQHTFAELMQGGWLTSHQPEGAWLYGADIGVDPAYRGRGLARALYAARHEAVRRLDLAGQVTVGLMNGYGPIRSEFSPQAYFNDLVAGRRNDPTVSAQRKVGFTLRCVVERYVRDPQCGDCGVLMTLPADQDVPWPTATRPRASR